MRIPVKGQQCGHPYYAALNKWEDSGPCMSHDCGISNWGTQFFLSPCAIGLDQMGASTPGHQ